MREPIAQTQLKSGPCWYLVTVYTSFGGPPLFTIEQKASSASTHGREVKRAPLEVMQRAGELWGVCLNAYTNTKSS